MELDSKDALIKYLKDKVEELEYKLNYDALTGSYSRYKLDKDFSFNLNYFILVDLNNLKLINDKFGHSKGDEVLIKVTNRLMSYGNTYRHGGDEFIMLINDKETVKRFMLENKNNKIFSFGVVRISDHSTFKDLLDAADKKMYKNKKNIKNKEYE